MAAPNSGNEQPPRLTFKDKTIEEILKSAFKDVTTKTKVNQEAIKLTNGDWILCCDDNEHLKSERCFCTCLYREQLNKLVLLSRSDKTYNQMQTDYLVVCKEPDLSFWAHKYVTYDCPLPPPHTLGGGGGLGAGRH